MPRWLALWGALVLLAWGRGAIAGAEGEGYALDRMADEASLELAPANRDPVEGLVRVPGPWRLVGTVDGVRTWEAPLPVRPRTLFFHRAPDDMAVFQRRGEGEGPFTEAGGRKLAFAYKLKDWRRDRTWAFSRRGLLVRRKAGAGPPKPGEYAVRYSRAVERERALNRDTAGLDDRAFAFRSLQLDDTTRTGIYLPAPSRARFDLNLPEGAVLDFEGVLLPPEAADSAEGSDGAAVVVRVDGREVGRVRLAVGDPRRARVPLPGGEGPVDLEIATEPLGDARLDYVLVADPVVHVPQADPRRVVLVFIDTLRRDHLSLYGYERPTTPRIDAWAERAAVFEQARSVAPWTLPSTRALLTGQQPELWGTATTLQERFARAGWATAFIAGNIYLSSNFDMADGWAQHRCINWPPAEVEVDRALDFLADHPDRPVFMVLHFMDMHLPYTEPLRYRHLFAGERPAAFRSDAFQRGDVVKLRGAGRDAARAYVQARYDNNLRYVDDQLARFLGALDEDDAVVIFADHGEEFWDHDGFEHGHTLYDELLRVPLVIRAPGIPAGRVEAPVSLMDVAPTVARIAGLSTEGMRGWPLQDLLLGDREADFRARPQAFGRPLYGARRWGVLVGHDKYLTTEGREAVYDLSRDPGEHDDIADRRDTARLRAEMAAGLDREVHLGFRLVAKPARAAKALTARLVVPGGVRAAYPAEDPTKSSDAEVRVEGEAVVATWAAQGRHEREIFVIPERPAAEVAGELQLFIEAGARELAGAPPVRARAGSPFEGRGGVILRARADGRTVEATAAVVPEPLEGGTAIEGFDEEVRGELQALGYLPE